MSGPAARPAPPACPGSLALATTSADQTRQLAGALAPLCGPGDVVVLAGDLGAGKTTFAQGFGAALGVTEAITSPTFILVRQYPVARPGAVRLFVHADVYRLDQLHEVVDLGLPELVEEEGVALVEWGDVAGPVLSEGSLVVRLAVPSDETERREITITTSGETWSGRWTAIGRALARWGTDR